VERRSASILVAGLIRLTGGRGSRPGPRAVGREARRPGRNTRDPGCNIRDTGMVTAEIAVGLLAVTMVLGLMLYAIGVGIAHVRTQESARAGARAAARGDTNSSVVRAAQQSLPGANVRISRSGSSAGSQVTVVVNTRIKPILALPSMKVSSRSVAEVEPR